MDDLISRQTAIEAITNYAKFLWDNYHETCHLAGMIDTIDSLPAAEPRWIPVTERLPEKTGSYLVTFQENENAISFGGDNPFIGVELFDGSEWHNCSWYDVLAWREKPEPWRGEEDEQRRSD